jgi:hypothetical protein
VRFAGRGGNCHADSYKRGAVPPVPAAHKHRHV